MHLTFTQFRTYVKQAYPTIQLIVLSTPTMLDDQLLAAAQEIAFATTPEGVDWTKIRDIAKGFVAILRFIADRTIVTWDNDIVAILEKLVADGRPPVFAPES